MNTISIEDNISRWLKPAVHEEKSSEWYGKRLETIKSIASMAKEDDKIKSLDLLRYFLEISSTDSKAEIDKEIKGEDIQYETGNDFLNRLLVGICLVSIFNSSSNEADCVGLAYSTYDFQKSCSKDKRLDIEVDLERMVDNYLNEECIKVRTNKKADHKITPPGTNPLKIKALNDSIAAITAQVASQPDQLKLPLTKLSEGLEKFREEYVEKIKEISNNFNDSIKHLNDVIEVNREENDIVWWILGEFSRDLKKPFESIESLQAVLLVGKELADLTHFLPGHYSAEAFIHKVLRNNQFYSKPTEIKFEQIIESKESSWDTSSFFDEQLHSVIQFCPIHYALFLFKDDKESWKRKFKTRWDFEVTREFSILTLAYQFYRESLLKRSI